MSIHPLQLVRDRTWELLRAIEGVEPFDPEKSLHQVDTADHNWQTQRNALKAPGDYPNVAVFVTGDSLAGAITILNYACNYPIAGSVDVEITARFYLTQDAKVDPLEGGIDMALQVQGPFMGLDTLVSKPIAWRKTRRVEGERLVVKWATSIRTEVFARDLLP